MMLLIKKQRLDTLSQAAMLCPYTLRLRVEPRDRKNQKKDNEMFPNNSDNRRNHQSPLWDVCRGIVLPLLLVCNAAAQTAPTIVTQPQSQTVAPGSLVTFSVTVSNVGPFTYQWQFNGTNLTNNLITTVAGSGSTALTGDGGQATNAGLALPSGVALDVSGDLFIADYGHNCIRMISPNGVISTVAGNGGQGFSGDGGPGVNANLNSPISVLPASGALYIDDYANNRIRKMDTNGIITTVAGNGTADFSGDGGPATSASLYSPTAIALDNFGNLLIADFRNNRIRKVDTNGIITTVAGSGPTGVGVGSFSGDGGPATSATFYNPNGVALDTFGNLFIADTLNNRIRKVDTNGVVSTVAGTGTGGFSGDGGPASSASFNNPYWISVGPSGNLFISDILNNRIREVTTDGNITTIAGNGQAAFSGDGGPAPAASLNNPGGTVALNGRVYISDFYNNRVREVNAPGGPTLTLSGVTAANAGGYTVVVSGPSESVTSSVAQLNLIIPPCAPAPSGLAGWWPGEGDARDLIGGNNGTLAGGASFASGEVGSAFTVNGDGQYISIPDAPALRPESLTVEGWYNFQATDNVRVMVAKPYGPDTWDSFAVWILDGQLEAGIVTTNAAQPWLVYPWSPTFGTWHHVAYTFDATAALQTFYVDGLDVASNSASGPIAYDDHPFQIGADIENGSPAFFFDGSIDEVSLYNRALTGPEIAAIFAAGSAGKCETAPVIAIQPQNEIVVVSGMATFSVTAGGAQPMTYQWNFGGTNIADATNSTLILTNVSFDMAGSYAVSITNSLGSTISSNAVLTVGIAPAVVISPATDALVQGTNFTLMADATGTGLLTFQWFQNGTALAQATASVLNFTNFQATNTGSYTVFVSSPFGTALSSNAILTIELLPALGSQPQSQAVTVGKNVTLSVSVNPPVTSGTLQLWLKADAGVVTGSSGRVGQWKDQSGNTNDAFQSNTNIQPSLVYPAGIGGMAAVRFNGVQDGVNGDYLHGTGNVGIPNAMTAFCVYNSFTDTNLASIPWLAGVPGAVTGASRCLAILDQELDFGMWSRDYQMPVPFPTNTYRICTDRINTNLNEVEVFDTTAATNANFNAAISGALTPAPGYYLGGLDPSLLHVSPDNFYGDLAELIIYKGYLSDSDRLAVQSYLQQKYLQTGGTPEDTFQWQFDGTNIAGGTNATLTITNVQGTDAGTYTVIVTDPAGSVTSSNAVLTALFPATIITSPVSQSVSAGTTVTFTGAASGTAPLSYQWQFGDANIAGATNTSLTLANAVIANAGGYTIVASNPYGSATSSVATLSVDESKVEVVSTSATAASTVVVSINLIALGTESGVGFTLNFDPAVLTYVDTAVGSGASGSVMQVNTNQVPSGRLGLGAAEFSGTFPAGTNDMFDVTFRTSVVTNTTTTSLTFGNSPANEEISDPTADSLPAVYSPGVVVISSTSLEGDVSPRPNGDQVLNISDWIQEGRFVAGLDTITNAGEFERADCAPRSTLGDGELTVADWVQVGRYAVGLDQLTAVGGPTTPAPHTRQSGHPGKDSDSPALMLVPLAQGTQINSVAVQLVSQGGVGAAGFSVTFNPASVQFINATSGSAATGAQMLVNTNQAASGTLGFVVGFLGQASFPAGTAPVATINFASAGYSNTTALAFGNTPVICQLVDTSAGVLTATFANASLAVGGGSWPTLSITPNGNSISLSWPSSGATFSLQAASSLGGAWTNVVATPTTNGDSVILMAPVSNDSVYYRLKY
jgi:hypothetical protein